MIDTLEFNKSEGHGVKEVDVLPLLLLTILQIKGIPKVILICNRIYVHISITVT